MPKLLAILLAAGCLLTAVRARGQEPAASENQPPAMIKLSDGTPVQLRFSQAIWGVSYGFKPRPSSVKEGNHVSLVVAEDVVLDGKVVLRKGSFGQATVAAVWIPSVDYHGVREYCTCFALQLDWIRSIDDELIPVRFTDKPDLKAKEKGKIKSFSLEVNKTPAGSTAQAIPYGFDALKGRALVKGMVGSMTGYSAFRTIHQRDWVPVGTRIMAYVDGDALLEASRIADAQDRLPAPNENAMLMLYRVKGKKDKQPMITCDNKELGPLGQKQFFAIEMEPGTHTCAVDGESQLKLDLSGGNEYYVYVHYAGMSEIWKLVPVSKTEGEDGVGAAEPAGSDEPVEKPQSTASQTAPPG